MQSAKYYKDALKRQDIEDEREERERHLATVFETIGEIVLDLEQKWIVDELLPETYLAVLAGPPKSGKTAFATALALAVATGTPFAGRETKQGGVLWIAAEESRAERRELLRRSPLADPGIPFYTTFEPLMIDTDEGLDVISNWISTAEARLVIVDPLIAACHSADFDRSWTARRALMRFKRLLAQHHVAGIVLHHSKSGLSDGSRRKVAQSDQLAATSSLNWVLSYRDLSSEEAEEVKPVTPATEEEAPQLAYILTEFVDTATLPPDQVPVPPPPTNTARMLRLETAGRGPFANRALHFLSKGPLDYVSIEPPTNPMPKPLGYGQREAAVLELLESESLCGGDICDRLHLNEGTLSNILTKLRVQGHIRIVGLERGHRIYGANPDRPHS